MTSQTRATLKSYFNTNDQPTEAQFADLIDSAVSVSEETALFPLLAGRAGGQTLYGGTGANDDITIHGTSDATRTTSYVLLQPTAGNVGIGTTAPATKLHVVGAATITEGIRPASDSTTALQLQTAAGANVLNVDTTNGRVGIGTTSPVAGLHVSKTQTNTDFRALVLQNNDTSERANSIVYQDFVTGNAATPRARFLSGGEVDWSGYSGLLSIQTQNSSGVLAEAIRIDSTQKVGIRTIPDYTLDVNGALRSRDMMCSFTVGGDTSHYYPVVIKSTVLSNSVTWWIHYLNFEISRDDVHQDGSSMGSFRLRVKAQASSLGHRIKKIEEISYVTGYGTHPDPVGDVQAALYSDYVIVWLKGGMTYQLRNLEPNTGAMLVDGNSTGVAKITQNDETWNIITAQSAAILLAKNAIYTEQKLSSYGLNIIGYATITGGIRPAADSTTALQLQNVAGTSVLNVDTTNARVGIGTTTPGYLLQSVSAGAGASEIVASNTAGVERIHFISRSSAGVSYIQSQNSQLLVGTYDNFAVQLLANNVSRVMIDTSGNVGINDVAPAEALDVTGNINTTGVYKVDDVQVLSNRVIDARCADAANSGDATTDGLIDALRDAMIAHGLIAAA